MTTQVREAHAVTNARGQLESIKELYREYKENASAFVSNLDTEESITERAREKALSVQFRSGWSSSTEDLEPEEFKILLSWGGPACQIIGKLDQYKEPTDIEIQYQDWGTPWTTYEISDNHDDYQALEWFCNCFYFGQ
tara:strand:- start:58 stop:471 length:414 start_codon:yes stop_codon:yes gene_type:complete